MIRTKDEFNALSRAGSLGNFLRSWDTPMAVVRSGYFGFLTIRSRVPDNTWFVAATHSHDGIHGWFWSDLALIGLRGGPGPEAFYFQEIPSPRAHRILNLEAMLTENGVELCYERDTTAALRGIRDRGTWAKGLRAQAVLRTVLSPESYDSLHAIWEKHPTSIIEATEWSVPCGAYQQQLTVWEVRDY